MISIKELNSLSDSLETIRQSETYGKMKLLRDNFFAHLDLSRYELRIEWTPNEIRDILKECQRIMNQISTKIFGSEMCYEFNSVNVGNHMFEDLMKYNQLIESIYEAYKSGRTYYETERIYNWLFHRGKLSYGKMNST